MQHEDHLDEVVRRAVELRTLSAAARAFADEVKTLSAELIKSVTETHAAVAQTHQQCLDRKARRQSHGRGPCRCTQVSGFDLGAGDGNRTRTTVWN